MKPNFALGMTSDGITLWQRGQSGWLRVGAVDPEAAERDAQLADLSRTAHALAPEGVTTKLVIPDEQILFCDLDVTIRNRAEQEHEIRAQLDGRTPYPVEELDFDWTIHGTQVHVAVVARETLVEAEEFANGFGLNPVSATAAPVNGAFNREPFFGATRLARSIVGDPDLIERDPEILRETGVAELPGPEMAEPEQATETPEAPVPEKVTAPEAEAKPAPPKAEAAKPPVDPDPVQEPVPGQPDVPEKLKAASKPAPEAKHPAAPADSVRKTGKEKDKRTEPGTSFADFLRSRGKKAAQDKAAGKAETAQPKSEPLTFSSRRGGTAKPAIQSQTAKTSGGMLGTLRSRLSGSAARTGAGVSITQKLRQSLADLKPQVAGTPKLTDALGSKRDASPAKPKDTGSRPASAATPAKAVQPEAPVAKSTSAPAAKSTSAPATARRDPLETLRDRSSTPESQSEAERLTIFGARQQTEAKASGRQRGLLILGGVGLLLAAVAVWVVFFTTTQDPAPDIAALPDADPAEIAAPEAMPPQDQIALPDTVAAIDELAPGEEIEAALGLEDAAQQPPIEAMDPESLAQGDQLEGSGGTAPEAPPSDLTAGRAAGLRSIALLAPEEAVPLPASPQPPAPFGSEPLPPLREELAAAPVAPAAPEPEDALPSTLPAGEEALEIAVTEGRPSAVPPARPEGIAPEPLPEPEPVVEPAPEPEAAAVDPLDESMLEIGVTQGSPAVVPPERPAGIAPEAEPEPQAVEPEAQPAPEAEDGLSDPDQARLDTPPPGGVALTALRPAERPEQIVQVALAPPPPEVPGAAEASDLAVAASARPGTRPSQFSAIVQRAMRAAQNQPATPAPDTPVQTASAAAAPVIPTSASVAREATTQRAINLRQINLIGVMGTSNNRRALVRLSNGRVVTVRVGERLDGGEVTAIGDGELRYTRRGRNVVLRIAS